MRGVLVLFLLVLPLAAQHEDWGVAQVPDQDGWKNARGFGWYRAYITVPKEWQGSRLLLIAGGISEVDEAFCNGDKVGANGSLPPLFQKAASNVRRPFVIEPDQVRFGEPNLIAWRVYNEKGTGGITSGVIHLSRADDAIDLSGTWLFRRGDNPAWAQWSTDREGEVASFRQRAGEQAAGHRGVVPADREGRKEMFAAVAQHFDGNKNPYARADDKGDPTPAEEAVKQFVLADGLAVDLVLSEPIVRQPLFIDFDERGRMWAVQYIQYPDPAGLEVLTWDKHLRKVFDQVPPPPPFVQTRNIGSSSGRTRSRSTRTPTATEPSTPTRPSSTSLNMVTSLAHGTDGVWVLHPPYLLFFADAEPRRPTRPRSARRPPLRVRTWRTPTRSPTA